MKMTEDKKKPEVAGKKGREKGKKQFHHPCENSMKYKSIIVGLEEDTYDIRASLDASKFRKSLQTLRTTYK